MYSEAFCDTYAYTIFLRTKISKDKEMDCTKVGGAMLPPLKSWGATAPLFPLSSNPSPHWKLVTNMIIFACKISRKQYKHITMYLTTFQYRLGPFPTRAFSLSHQSHSWLYQWTKLCHHGLQMTTLNYTKTYSRISLSLADSNTTASSFYVLQYLVRMSSECFLYFSNVISPID